MRPTSDHYEKNTRLCHAPLCGRPATDRYCERCSEEIAELERLRLSNERTDDWALVLVVVVAVIPFFIVCAQIFGWVAWLIGGKL